MLIIENQNYFQSTVYLKSGIIQEKIMNHNHIIIVYNKYYKWNNNSMAHYLHKAKEIKFCINMPLKLALVNAQYTNYGNEFSA